jgi:hypothetical protein
MHYYLTYGVTVEHKLVCVPLGVALNAQTSMHSAWCLGPTLGFVGPYPTWISQPMIHANRTGSRRSAVGRSSTAHLQLNRCGRTGWRQLQISRHEATGHPRWFLAH